MIRRMLAIWSLVPLPFLKPSYYSGPNPDIISLERYLSPSLVLLVHPPLSIISLWLISSTVLFTLQKYHVLFFLLIFFTEPLQ